MTCKKCKCKVSEELKDNKCDNEKEIVTEEIKQEEKEKENE